MIDMRVCRDASSEICEDDDPRLKWGDDISDELLCTELAAQERGRVEIDGSYTNRRLTSVTLPSLVVQQPGDIINIVEGINAGAGILRGITLNITRGVNSISIGTVMKVERNV